MLIPFVVTDTSIVLCEDVPMLLIKASGMNIPIWIGPADAQAILMGITKETSQRPMTHDLMLAFLATASLKVQKIAITELRDWIFIATIFVERDNDEVVTIDARPSDAISIALRAGAEMFIEEDVMLASLDMPIAKKVLESIERQLPEALET